jgi:hypothetical protein
MWYIEYNALVGKHDQIPAGMLLFTMNPATKSALPLLYLVY